MCHSKKRDRNDKLLKKCVLIESADLWYYWKMLSIYQNRSDIKKKRVYSYYVKNDRSHRRIEFDWFDQKCAFN